MDTEIVDVIETVESPRAYGANAAQAAKGDRVAELERELETTRRLAEHWMGEAIKARNQLAHVSRHARALVDALEALGVK